MTRRAVKKIIYDELLNINLDRLDLIVRKKIIKRLLNVIVPIACLEWVNKPNPAFAGKTPRDMILSGNYKPLLEMLSHLKSGEPSLKPRLGGVLLLD